MKLAVGSERLNGWDFVSVDGEFPAAEDHAPTQYHLQNLRRAFLNRGCDRMRDAYSGMMVTGVRPTLEVRGKSCDERGVVWTEHLERIRCFMSCWIFLGEEERFRI